MLFSGSSTKYFQNVCLIGMKPAIEMLSTGFSKQKRFNSCFCLYKNRSLMQRIYCNFQYEMDLLDSIGDVRTQKRERLARQMARRIVNRVNSFRRLMERMEHLVCSIQRLRERLSPNIANQDRDSSIRILNCRVAIIPFIYAIPNVDDCVSRNRQKYITIVQALAYCHEYTYDLEDTIRPIDSSGISHYHEDPPETPSDTLPHIKQHWLNKSWVDYVILKPQKFRKYVTYFNSLITVYLQEYQIRLQFSLQFQEPPTKRRITETSDRETDCVIEDDDSFDDEEEYTSDEWYTNHSQTWSHSDIHQYRLSVFFCCCQVTPIT